MYCVVKDCGSIWKPTSNVIFHSFPSDLEKRCRWLSNIQLKGNFYKSAKICSLHFKPEDYDLDRPNRLLMDAIPSYFVQSCPCSDDVTACYVAPYKCSAASNALFISSHQSESDTNEEDPVITTDTVKVKDEPDPLHMQRCNSPSGLSDIDSSDLEGALDTPAMLILKRKLRDKEEKLREKEEKLQEKDEKLRELNEKLRGKEEICKDHVKKIESLQKTNKHLSEKNIALKQLLVKMKRKLMILKPKFAADLGDRESQKL